MDILEQIFLFHDLDLEARRQITQFSKKIHIAKDEILFLDGEAATAFYVVIKGKVNVFKMTPNGDERILHQHGDLDLVAEAAIWDKEFYPASCKAVAATDLIRIPKKEFLNFLSSHVNLMFKMMASYSRRLRDFVDQVESLGLSDVRDRIIKYILKNGTKNNGYIILELEMSKKEWAYFLGTVPETLSRTLKKLKDDKILNEVDGKIQLNTSLLTVS